MADYFDVLFAGSNSGGSAPVLEEVTKSYTANGDDVIEPSEGYDGISKVNVSVNVSGGGEAPENDVEFIDYDGTIVYSYTAEQFLALDAMPANPTHEGLTAQGWNWTLADAKEYVGDYGEMVIGQMYITDDGKTRVYIRLNDPNYLSPYVGICPNGTATIDWGDGTTPENVSGSSVTTPVEAHHNYATTGDYVISITAPTGDAATLGISGTYSTNVSTLLYGRYVSSSNLATDSTAYASSIYKIELGTNVSIQNRAFRGLTNLETLTIPNGSTYAGAYTFYYAIKLLCVIVPLSWTVFDSSNDSGNTFSQAISLKYISFPKTVDITRTVNISNFARVTFPASTSTTTYPFGFYNLLSTKSLAISYGPGLGGSLNTSLALQKVVIGNRITELNSSSFNGQGSVRTIKFLSTTPPTASSSSTFNGVSTACKIYVPYSEDHSVLNAYKTATNYPNPSTYTYVEY